jgi:hypothetical protein
MVSVLSGDGTRLVRLPAVVARLVAAVLTAVLALVVVVLVVVQRQCPLHLPAWRHCGAHIVLL